MYSASLQGIYLEIISCLLFFPCHSEFLFEVCNLFFVFPFLKSHSCFLFLRISGPLSAKNRRERRGGFGGLGRWGGQFLKGMKRPLKM